MSHQNFYETTIAETVISGFYIRLYADDFDPSIVNGECHLLKDSRTSASIATAINNAELYTWYNEPYRIPRSTQAKLKTFAADHGYHC